MSEENKNPDDMEGHTMDPLKPGSQDRDSILQRLENGEIDPETALNLLGGSESAAAGLEKSNEDFFRMNVLERLERGEMEAEEALAFLEGRIPDRAETMEGLDLLNRIEAGTLSPEEAVQLLESSGERTGKSAQPGAMDPDEVEDERESLRGRARWGLFAVSAGLSAVGGWLASLGGWWWLGAVPLLLLGLPLLILVVVSWRSVWLFVNVHTGEDWPKRIIICFPMPLQLTGWVIRNFGGSIHGLNHTTVDELLVELENSIQNHKPIAIDVHETESGERVQVYLG